MSHSGVYRNEELIEEQKYKVQAENVKQYREKVVAIRAETCC